MVRVLKSRQVKSVFKTDILPRAGYSKNTIRLQPVSQKTPFNPADIVIFRLPTNAIVDLKTLVLSFDLQITSTTSGNIALPKFSQSLFRRVDVTAGGVQVGLGSLNDYGGLWSLYGSNGIGTAKGSELSVEEMVYGASSGFQPQSTAAYGCPSSGNGYATLVYGGSAGAAGTATSTGMTYFVLPPPTVTTGTGTNYYRLAVTGWMGFLDGSFNRFLDTNLMPDIEIRLTLANANVLVPNNSTAVFTWGVNTPVMETEVVSFGDDTYRQIVEARLSTGEPIVVPFTNHASFETSVAAGSTSAQTQFTVGCHLK